jgi:MYXO-CTERM domain-containing protein
LCATASQEIAHTYGLDHSFSFLDGRSSCRDPMTYRFDCGGQKFFRNDIAVCGELAVRDCRCGPTQNSHTFLLNLIGAGTPTTSTTVSITSPEDGASIGDGATIVAPAFGQRGITEVVFRLNTYVWEKLPGRAFGPDGQPLSNYNFTLPPDVPDGVIDIEVEARDDLNVVSTAKVTVTKGAPCATADTCAAGQYCDAGRCIWDPPAGEVGDACEYQQFCVDERCDTHDGESFCTRGCVTGIGDACPMGLECVDDPAGDYCWPVADSAGCCSTTSDMPWTGFAFALGVLGLLARRRR